MSETARTEARGVIAVALLAPALLGMQCGPTGFEAGAAVLLATPVAVLAGLGLLAGLQALWRRHTPDLRLPLRFPLGLAAVALVTGLIALASASEARVGEWVGVAMLTFGPSFLTLLLLAWRIALAYRPERAARRAFIFTALFMVGPAFLLLPVSSEAMGVLILWVYPGFYGIPPLIIAIALYVEAATRQPVDRAP